MGKSGRFENFSHLLKDDIYVIYTLSVRNYILIEKRQKYRVDSGAKCDSTIDAIKLLLHKNMSIREDREAYKGFRR